MTLTRKRTKMVCIRLSDDEFRKLHEACATIGARSISDLARDAMNSVVAQGGYADLPDDDICVRLEDLNRRMTLMQKELLRLSSIVGEAHE
ncbi:hypothetical protein [Paludibaculum fermentans]|uniref:Ribbon-helix-helix protein CopG domain-containing protein n=1 Tax=Paludibaculum fermentans TaxID=1473598 RepID=A0A7S7NMA7_PALFE|nr:hypothetical protein [Paludibaculum fermentans]QOY86262.1 hypothetical protein IRI77_26095 [Paludibaculum fermentans]